MFETTVDRLAARRVARITFGSVLIVGAAVLVLGPYLRLPFSSAEIMLGSWFIATLLSLSVGRLPIHTDPQPLFKASLVVPTIGIALMAPLLIHLPFALVSQGSYDTWVGLSVVIVGTAHLAFAITTGIRAARVVDDRPAMSPWICYAITVGVSCVPFALLLLIPPVLVALTALPLMPLVYFQNQLADRERALVTTPSVPRAIAWAA
jgi:hypothetical protein